VTIGIIGCVLSIINCDSPSTTDIIEIRAIAGGIGELDTAAGVAVHLVVAIQLTSGPTLLSVRIRTKGSIYVPIHVPSGGRHGAS